MDRKSNDIIRYAGDTYPTKTEIQINGIGINIDKYNVDLRYIKPDGSVYIVDCVKMDSARGLIGVYPHARRCDSCDRYNEALRLTPDRFESNESQNAETNNDGIAPNQVWDEDEAGQVYRYSIVRWRQFEDGYIEEMTHASGKIILLDRWVQS